MKKNRMMRLAAFLLVCVLLTTSVISGTYAKYVSTTTDSDSARVAKWGFGTASIAFEDLFAASYENVAAGSDELAIIAPGTAGSVSFAFEATGSAPEVAYKIVVDTDGSGIHTNIENNPNIVWQLDANGYGTWDEMLGDIAALSQARVEANALPTNFGKNATHTIYWKWIFDENATNKETNTANNDTMDTNMGNGAVTTEQSVTLVVNIKAEQID